MGVFISLEEPSREMKTAALKADCYRSPGFGRAYPKIQILTVEQLLRGAKVDMPPSFGTFKQAERMEIAKGQQGLLELR